MGKFWWAWTLALWMGIASAQGGQTLSADGSVKAAVETVVKASKTDAAAKNGDVNAMAKVVQREFLPYTDFERTTRLAVGSPWKTATPDQRKQLVQQFTRLLVVTYAVQLTQIQDQNVAFTFTPASLNAGGDDAVVQTEVKGAAGGNDDMQVGYRLAKTPSGWRIYDINMMGMWLIQIYQRQFADQLGKNGVDGLIHYLTDHNERFAS
jgi:phospholipid transport system substrate-binding protein